MKTQTWDNEFTKLGGTFFAGRMERKASFIYPMHTHRDYAELFLIESGTAQHHINETICPVPEKTLILIRPSDRHGFDVPHDAYTVGYVSFPIETLEFLRNRYFRNENRFFWVRSKMPAHIMLSSGSFLSIENELERLFSKARIRVHVERFLLTLLAELLDQADLGTQNNAPAWLRCVLENLQDPELLRGGTKVFLEKSKRRPEYVSRAVKKFTGMTPTEVVNKARMTYAADQLKLTRLSLFAGKSALFVPFSLIGLPHIYFSDPQAGVEVVREA